MFDPEKSVLPPNLEGLAPGAELGAALGLIDYANLTPRDMIRVLKAQRRQVAHYEAASYWTMNEIVSVYEDPEHDYERETERALEGAAEEIGAALRLSRRAAGMEAALALEMNRKLPSVHNTLLRGEIDLRRAKVLVDATLHVHPTTAQKVVDTILPEAGQLTTGQLKSRISKLCIDENPADALNRYEWDIEDRRVIVEANPSGTANLKGLDLPPHIVKAIMRRVHRMAIDLRNSGDSRTMDQLRADILLDLLQLRGTGANTENGNDLGRLNIDVDAATLAGLNDNAGYLNGYGPVLADIARQIAEHEMDAQWTWTLRDPDTGRPIDGGITRRRPTAAQRRKVEAIHGTCLHPGCRMPSADCDIDHRIPWEERKLTVTDDLGPLCRHHHGLRQKFGWSYAFAEGGDAVFTSPFRIRYTTSGRPP